MENKNIKTLSVKIDASKLDIKNTEKESVNDYNLQEIRGWIIDQLNFIELKLDIIITKYFKPEKEREFKSIFLNSSIVSTGAKMKILKNIPDMDNSLITNIQKLTSIRNAFAHVPMTMSASFIFEKNTEGELESKILNVISELAFMNSNGQIKNVSVKLLLTEFTEICDKVNPILDELIKTKK